MGVLVKKIKIEGSKGEKEVKALFDSGASYSCISPKLAEELEVCTPIPSPLEFKTAEEGRTLKAEKRVTLDFYIDGYRFSDEFMVIENLSEEVIIGSATMQKWRLKLDFEKEKIIINPEVTKLRLLKMKSYNKDKKTFETIKKEHPDMWVLLGNCEFDRRNRVKKGILLAASKKRDEIYLSIEKFKSEYKNLVIKYTGEIPEDLKVLLMFKKVYFNPELNLIILNAFLYGKRDLRLGVSLALDTGATLTTISWEILEAMGYSPSLSTRRSRLITGSGVEYAPLVKIKGISVGDVFIGPLDVYAHTFPQESYIDGVIGLNFLKRFYYCIEHKKGVVKFREYENKEVKNGCAGQEDKT